MPIEQTSAIVGSEASFSVEELVVNSFFEPFADVPLGIIVIGRKGHIRFFNVMAGYFLGIPPSIALHRPIEAIIPSPEILDVLRSGVTVHERQELVNDRLLKYSMLPIVIDGKILFAVQFMQDVTETMMNDNYN